jgi:hypothetical protein
MADEWKVSFAVGRPYAGPRSTSRALLIVALPVIVSLLIFRTQPTKNPDSLIGFGVVLVAVGLNPTRPYSLPAASVSKESVSRERRFIEKSGLAGIFAHAPAHY